MKRGSKMTKRMAMLSLAFCVCSSVAWDSSQSRNDNSVTSLNYSQESARTLIEIGVQADPTFSVYTLKNPERVVVEILDCDSSARVSPVQVRNGIIDTAAISVSQTNNYSTCRVILGLEKEASYAVDSTADRITVAIDGKPEMKASEMADAYEAKMHSQEEALASARSVAARAQAEAAAARSEAFEAAQREQAAIERARADAAAAREEARLSAEREKAALAKLEQAYNEAKSRVSSIEAQRDEAQLKAQLSEADKQIALENAQAELVKAKANAAALESAKNKALERAQNAESQRDLAQAQARESLMREQQAISKLQQEQKIAAENSALLNSQIQKSQAEKSALLADLNEKTNQAALLSERAERAQAEAARLVDETRRNEEARVADAENRVAAAESRVADAMQKAKDAQNGSAEALSASQEELQMAKTVLSQTQRERDDAISRAKNAESKAQNALDTADVQKKQADAQLALLNQKLIEANNRIASLENERTNANSRIATLENERTNANSKIASLENERTNANSKIASLENERTNANSRIASLENERTNAKSRIATLENERTNANSKIATLENERTNANSKIASLENERTNANSRIASLENERTSANSKIASLENERTSANSKIASLENERTNANSKIASLENERTNANNRIASLENERTAAQRKADSYAQNNAGLAAQNAELIQKLAQQDAEMAKLNEEVLAGGAARKKLKELESASETRTAQQEAEIAELKAQARQGRHAREQLLAMQAENELLRNQLTDAQTQMAATTVENAAPAYAQIATTVPPIDSSVGVSESARNTVAPIDQNAAAHASVRDIQFKNNIDGGMQVVLKMSAPVEKVENLDAGSQKSVLRIAGAVLPDNFNKKYDTSAFNQGVRFIDSTQADGGIELIAQASSRTIDSIEQNGDTITWNIRPLRDASTLKAPVDRRNNSMLTAAEPSPSLMGASSYGAASNLKNSPLAKRKITLDIHDADVNDLLRLLSDEINTSIVVSPDVKGNVTLSLKSVPLDQALDIIMRMHDLGMRYEGNVIWIAKAETFRAEEQAALKAAEMREKLEPLEVRLIPVNYALANELSDNIKDLLSSRGSVNIDSRTNTLILKDVAANLDAAEILVSNLDTQTPQILIEARIVETQANFTKEIGIQWGGDGVASAATGNATGIVFPSTIGIAGASTSDNNMGVSSTPNFAVNLPAAVGTGSGGALGITLGSLGGTINLNIRLSSLEEKGYLKIVSSPRIMTLDNIQASIESGVSIPISVVSAAGVQTVFIDAKLNLQVTPHVTRDGNVYLKIDITKNEADFGNTGANGDPSIIRKEAHTELLVPDGDTTVIGGIYSRNTSQSMSSVPFWGSIPILGYLFRNTSETDNRNELLIFITPRIINRDASISASGHGSFIPPVERDDKSK